MYTSHTVYEPELQVQSSNKLPSYAGNRNHYSHSIS